jgi:pyridoxal phosphate enzyme (YggS family)
VSRLFHEIAEEAVKAGRDPAEISLMAVTKTQPPEKVNAAVAAGITLLGENRAQELLDKYEAYDKDGVDIHFIGRLQSNKAKQIVDKVGMIHSVDSARLAEEINRRCEKLGKSMDVLIEVNIAGEPSKSGVPPEAVGELVENIGGYSALRLRGLMTVPPVCDAETEIEGYFLRMRQLYVDIRGKKMDNVPMACFDTLSMGMSGDYLPAIRQGATVIRLGSAIFGHR